jgi:hypothetical protein
MQTTIVMPCRSLLFFESAGPDFMSSPNKRKG